MKILILSYNDITKDGRLNEIKKVMQYIGEVYVINAISSGDCIALPNTYTFKHTGVLSYFFFIFYCIIQTKKLGHFDMIVADNRKGIIPAFFSKIINQISYSLYDAREFYIYKEMTSFCSKIGCLIEKIFVPYFQIIICANKYRANGMRQLYNLKYNPIDFENIRRLEYSDFSEQECEKEFLHLFKDNKFINIVTTSGEALIRHADVLVKAIAHLGKNYRLFLIGYEDKEGNKKIKEICKKSNWNNIIRYKWLSKSQLKYIISHCNIGIVNYSFQNTNNKYCASGKLYEFVFEKIPVVTTSNPPLKHICQKYEIGVSDDSFFYGIKKVINNYEFYKQNVIKFSKNINIENYLSNVAKQISKQIDVLNN